MERIKKAVEFAAKVHLGQVRKSSGLPFITHPYMVGMLLMQNGCDEDTVAAGILHDTVEDTQTTMDDIQREFGDRIAFLVDLVSEDMTKTWDEKKEKTIQDLKSAPYEVKMIIVADKLHNLMCKMEQYQKQGEEIWKTHKRSREKQEWYLRQIYQNAILNIEIPHHVTLFNDFKQHIDSLFSF